jgi:hypothetical protein
MKKPNDMLIYYGWLNAFNSARNAWDNEKVSQELSRYGVLVFGAGLEDPSHGDYANTQVILARVKALNPNALIFGYVTINQDYATFTPKVDGWETLQVHGIFLDEAGYDFGKTRAEFNQRVDYVHGRSYAKLCFANSWNLDHILGTTNDPSYPNSTYNPSAVESNLTATDWTLLESFPVNSLAYGQGYESATDWVARGEKSVAKKSAYGINIASISVIANSSSNGQKFADFAYAASIAYSVDGFGTSDEYYGASSAAVRWWERPCATPETGVTVFQDSVDSDIYQGIVGDQRVSLDFSSSAQTSSIKDGVACYGSIYTADNTTTQSISSTPVKYTGWNGNGPSSNVSVSHTSDSITILVPGVYEVSFCSSAYANLSGDVEFHLRKNGTEQPAFGAIGRNAKVFTSANFCNLASFVAGDVLEVYVKGPSTTLKMQDAQLVVKRVG